MKQLVEQVLNNNHNIKIKSFMGDAGAYDNMRISNILKEKRIRPIIKVKRNSIISTKNNKIRNREVEFKQRIIINGKRKESMDNDGWLKKQHFLL